MSEKKVYVFSSRWGRNSRISYWKHCLENNVVFINSEHDSVTNFPEIARGVKKGDVIALRDGETMYAVGIANNDAEVKNVLTGKPLFNNEEELTQYGIGNNIDLVCVTVDTWKILNDSEKQLFNISGMQDRIKLLSDDSYHNAREKILSLLSI